jgi:hypothetical protein
MKSISERLWSAIAAIAAMQHPSVAHILRVRGFAYEADRIDELTTAFEQEKEETNDVKRRPHRTR